MKNEIEKKHASNDIVGNKSDKVLISTGDGNSEFASHIAKILDEARMRDVYNIELHIAYLKFNHQ